MFLDEDDLIVDARAPGRVKRQLRVTNKPHLGLMTKNGKTRYVHVDRDLMDKLLTLKATKSPSRLLFGTANGLPDYHMLDTLRSIARRAGIEPPRCWLLDIMSERFAPDGILVNGCSSPDWILAMGVNFLWSSDGAARHW